MVGLIEWIGTLTGRKPERQVTSLYRQGESIGLSKLTNSSLDDVRNGSVVRVFQSVAGAPHHAEVLAHDDDPRSLMYKLAAEHGFDPSFAPEIHQEVDALLLNHGIDDPSLDDLTDLPFVTIDGPGTRDLDQALYVKTEGRSVRVLYALADAAYYVRPGSHLFEEALRRGSSYYLPGLAVPMLPRSFSEGLVSLNEGVDRRAMVFDLLIGPDGECQQAAIRRARIRSRYQLTFEDVARYLAGAGDERFHGQLGASLQAMKEVGMRRIKRARRYNIVRYRRSETEVRLEGDQKMRFVIVAGRRGEVELYNEQLSLLCNVEGAKWLRAHATEQSGDHLQPIYRIHPHPNEERYDQFEDTLRALVERHKLEPSRWEWTRNSPVSLAEYLESLPHDGAQGRLARAIHRQAVMMNVRSSFSPSPGRHHGIGADEYARYSAPMREMVGVFVHKETWERLERSPQGSIAGDLALRDVVVERANTSKTQQKAITRAANELVLNRLFSADPSVPARQWLPGTVMGLTRSKVHVSLDSPPIEVKVYTFHLGTKESPATITPDQVALEREGCLVCRLGDAVEIRVTRRDEKRDRWTFELRLAN